MHEDFETSGIVGNELKARIERKFGDLRLRQAHYLECERSVAASAYVRVSGPYRTYPGPCMLTRLSFLHAVQ